MALKKRILVCGGRDYRDAKHAYEVLDNLKKWFDPNFIIIQGEAAGADYLGKQWGKANGRPVIGVEANWDFYKKPAGGIRNGWMLEFCTPDLVVAFPGGTGTSSMITKARQAGVDVYEG
jgi:predicted Rossmann-fold nucleotide-binding protein